MIVPATEVARLAASVFRTYDGVVKVIDKLEERGVSAADLGLEDILAAMDDAKAVLDAVVAEHAPQEEAH